MSAPRRLKSPENNANASSIPLLLLMMMVVVDTCDLIQRRHDQCVRLLSSHELSAALEFVLGSFAAVLEWMHVHFASGQSRTIAPNLID